MRSVYMLAAVAMIGCSGDPVSDACEDKLEIAEANLGRACKLLCEAIEPNADHAECFAACHDGRVFPAYQ